MNRATTYELLKPIIEGVSRVVKIKTITNNLDNTYTLTSCNTKWLTIKRTITIGVVDYQVTNIIVNQSITISGPSLPVATSFTLYPFYFVHGTIRAAVDEHNNKQKQPHTDRLPFIYLRDITPEKFNYDPELNKDRDSDCELYFMTDCDFTNWNTIQHENYAIKPMRNLLFDVVEAIKTSSNVDNSEIINTGVKDHARFGIYTDGQGHPKKIFDDYLSGTQLNITVPFLQGDDCDC